jgi:ribosomal-protein-alanine N-acetyltransferase
MNIVLDGIVIRDFQRKDAEPLHKIVRESEIIRFMKDWSENAPTPEDFYGYIDWLQTKKDSTDVYENKRYAIALSKTNELIGMVGMGLEDTVNEVEVVSLCYRPYYCLLSFGKIAWCEFHYIAYITVQCSTYFYQNIRGHIFILSQFRH